MLIELRCATRGHTAKRWILDLNGPAAVLSTPEGQQICRFTSEEASERWIYPRFGGEHKHFTIQFDEQTVPFKVSRDGLKQIKRFLLQSIVNEGEDAVLEFKARAARSLALGAGSLGLGVILTVGSFLVAAGKAEGGTYLVFTGFMVFGAYQLLRGGWLLSQCRELGQLAEQPIDRPRMPSAR